MKDCYDNAHIYTNSSECWDNFEEMFLLYYMHYIQILRMVPSITGEGGLLQSLEFDETSVLPVIKGLTPSIVNLQGSV